MANAPTEAKVYNATIGAGSGAIATTFVLWVIGITAFRAPYGSEFATEAVLAVPAPLSAFVGLLLTAGGAYVGGWYAKHTPRAIEEYVPRRALDESEVKPLETAPTPAVEDSKVYEPEIDDEEEDLDESEPKNV